MAIRVLIADDSALMRKKIREMLESSVGIEVVGAARDGEDVLKKAEELRPHVITLDVNMPNMDGLTALKHLVERQICPVVMLSSLTQEGADITFEALDIGAFDFVPKPGGTVSLHVEEIKKELIQKVRAAAKANMQKLTRNIGRTVVEKKPVTPPKPIVHVSPHTGKGVDHVAVCIGVSTGGPKTILDVLPHLPANLNAAVYVVQHMPGGFTASYARRLNEYSQIQVKEAAAGDMATAGTCYIGKGGYHLTLHRNMNSNIVVRLKNTPKTIFMPSADTMMRSVAEVYGDMCIGVLLTGMGDDGADAMGVIRQFGGYTIAESDETAIVYGMPREAVERGNADIVLPSYKIADEIIRRVREFSG